MRICALVSLWKVTCNSCINMQFPVKLVYYGVFSLTSVVVDAMIISPSPRERGSAFESACGTFALHNSGDPDLSIQDQTRLLHRDVELGFATGACNLWQCQGTQFVDNEAKLNNYSAGEVISIVVDTQFVRPGIANMSIVDTRTNSVLSKLANMKLPMNNRVEQDRILVRLPKLDDENGACRVPGECVLQLVRLFFLLVYIRGCRF